MIILGECRVSAQIDNKVTLLHFALNQQLRFNRRNHERTKKYKESQKDSYIILFISR